MIDMFTILLVFLLKSYSVEYSNVLVSKELRLPVSTETRSTQNILNVIITKKEVLVDGDNAVTLYNGRVNHKDMSADGAVIRPLYRILQNRRQLQNESISGYFKGKIILQADRTLHYSILHKVLYTAGEAGYPKFKLLVLRTEE